MLYGTVSIRKFPPSKITEEWLHLAKKFEERWDFNHCIGAIDSKHVTIEVMLLINATCVIGDYKFDV
jgi:hypothetical protein